jgi:hypothetical protein
MHQVAKPVHGADHIVDESLFEPDSQLRCHSYTLRSSSDVASPSGTRGSQRPAVCINQRMYQMTLRCFS